MEKRTPPDPARIRAMFARIAARYDLLNHLLSANLDRGWRKAAVSQLGGSPLERVLDLCGGTGDLTVAVGQRTTTPLVVCCDFARPMLVRASRKFRSRRLADRCVALEGDGLLLPFRDESFDAVTVAFGLRNLGNLERGLQEIRRVLRQGGRLVVLEFSRPRGPVLSRLYRFYLQRVVPRVGEGLADGPGAYGYLARSIRDFPAPEGLASTIRGAGFTACDFKVLTGGIVAIHTAMR